MVEEVLAPELMVRTTDLLNSEKHVMGSWHNCFMISELAYRDIHSICKVAKVTSACICLPCLPKSF